MMRFEFWVLTISVVFLAGCPVPPDAVFVPPGGLAHQTDPCSGGKFYIYVPTKYDHKRPIPVIISCHGTIPFDVAAHHIDNWEGYGEVNNCIVVCPELDGTDGIFGDGPIDGMRVNERRILSILSTLSYKYNIDRNNIMITGFSGGGFPAYWVGLRNPDIFSAVVAQNCNFNQSNLDRWYPHQAVNIPLMVYYGENDPGTIIDQSRRAIDYLRRQGFRVETYIIPNAGHDRHPEIAMRFFRNHWRSQRGTHVQKNSGIDPQKRIEVLSPRGPRPPRRR